MFKRLLYILAFQILVIHLYGYTDKKAIIVVNKDFQSDTFNYNIVSSFLQMIYNAVLDEKIVFWDSPLKQTRINADNFLNIDQSNEINFLESHNFFIYETWNSESKTSSFAIVGFLFTNENKKGEEINYGFIDFEEVRSLLKTERIPTDANGDYLLTFYQIFMNKTYNYDLIFFDDKPIISSNSGDPEKDFSKGVKIKNKAFGPEKYNLNQVEVIPSKLITYELKTFNYDLISEKIIDALEKYFVSNNNAYVCFSSEDVSSMFKGSKLLITSLEINILATVKNNETVFKLLSIVPYSLGKAFYPIDHIALDSLMIITADSLDIRAILNSMKYDYQITKINNIKVNPEFTIEYMNAVFQRNYKNIVPKGRKP